MRISSGLLLVSIFFWTQDIVADPAVAEVSEIRETISQVETSAKQQALPKDNSQVSETAPQAVEKDIVGNVKKVVVAAKEKINTAKINTLSTQGQVDYYVKQLNTLNKQKYSSTDEDKINLLLAQQEQLISNLLSVLRQAKISQLKPYVDAKRVSFLKSRMAINHDLGNTLAVKRDRFRLAYYQSQDQISDYLEYLILAAKTYMTVDQVVSDTVIILAKLKQDTSEIILPEANSESEVYSQLASNYQRYLESSGAFHDILEYVTSNPTVIAKAYWFQKFSLLSMIYWVNSLDFVKPINYKLAPTYIDVGGITISVIILTLIIICLPLYIRFVSWFIDRFIVNQVSDHSTLIVQELRRPLRILLLFFSFDMAMYALLYKSEYKASLDHVDFVVYAAITVWVVFKLFDTLFIIQVEKIARRNKELRKELVTLGVQFAKAGVVVLVLTFILNRFGISITAIVSTLGIGGLAFALAAKDSLSNLFGGMTILIDNVFRMGDWVCIGKDEGTVAEIGLRSTTIRTFDNALITIPNSIVSVNSIKNWNRRAVGRRIKMYIGVTYDADMNDLRQAIEDIRTMLSNHPDISNPKEKYGNKRVRFKLSAREDTHGIKSTQLVFLDRYSDFSIDIMVYCFSKTVVWSEWLRVKEDVLFRLADILAKNKLAFAYPTEVNINRFGSPMEMPQELLPKQN